MQGDHRGALLLSDDTGDHGALGGIVNDDRLAGVADTFKDGGQVAGPSSGSGLGVGGGETGDGLEVVEEGEAVDDEDVGLGDNVGGKSGGTLGGQGNGGSQR